MGQSKYLEMDMLIPLYGEASVPVTPEDSQIYLVVVSAPDFCLDPIKIILIR